MHLHEASDLWTLPCSWATGRFCQHVLNHFLHIKSPGLSYPGYLLRVVGCMLEKIHQSSDEYRGALTNIALANRGLRSPWGRSGWDSSFVMLEKVGRRHTWPLASHRDAKLRVGRHLQEAMYLRSWASTFKDRQPWKKKSDLDWGQKLGGDKTLSQWFSTFLKMWRFMHMLHVVVTTNPKFIFDSTS